MKFMLRIILGIEFLALQLSVAYGDNFYSSMMSTGKASMQLVDLTHPFDNNTVGYPGIKEFQLNVLQNGTTDEGYWLQIEYYESGIHMGTHMDAPCHIKRGQWCLDKIPIDRFIGCAAVVDITDRTSTNPDANLEVEDLKKWEEDNGRTLDGTIILVNSGWSQKWSNPDEFLGTTTDDRSKLHFPGVSPAAARWLRDNREIYGLGVETVSLDNGFVIEPYAHEALFEANIYGLENVANVNELPAFGALCYVLPMKIYNASGAPVRIICNLSSNDCKTSN